MVKKVFLVLPALILLLLATGATFKNKSWNGADFPYIGALFCHDGDYVKFWCSDQMHSFYFMTYKDANAYIEFYIDGKGLGTVNEIKNKWNGKHFGSEKVNWQRFDLGSSFWGHYVEIHLVENRTVNGKYCTENDIMIKLEDNSQAVLWRNVDSTSYCDLDLYAK